MTPWLTLAVLVLMFAALVREVWPADVTLFSALVVLWAMGVIDIRQATVGFSNPQVLTIGLLFVIAAAMRDTGALRKMTQWVFRRTSSHREMLARVMLPTASASAFLNNTPIVAMLTPAVRDWAHDNGKAPSQLLIPLSYSTILGGTCTLIGTSTNLVVSGLLEESGHAPLSMFELTAVGLPATVCGIAFILIAGPYLLPKRQSPEANPFIKSDDAGPRYGVRFKVTPDGPLVGKTVATAGLRHLEGVFLVEIIRRKRRLAPARSTDRLEGDDQLVFVGIAEKVAELLSMAGLAPVSEEDARESEPLQPDRIHEIVISENSWLIGKTLREANFRRRYDAAVIVIHRGGERLHQKLGDVQLHQGDTLLVLAAKGFRATWSGTADFFLISHTDEPAAADGPTWKSTLSLLILGGMVTLMTFGVTSILMAVAIAALLLIITRCIDPDQARKSIDLSVLVLIASSFGISTAVESSGLASIMGELVVAVSGVGAPLVALAAIYLLCATTTEMLSNNAAAAILFPIAISTAERLSLDPRPFAIAVTFAASMSFITPLGYQTNLLVYGPGGYRFSDFIRIGLPLAVVCFIVAMIAIPLVWPLV